MFPKALSAPLAVLLMSLPGMAAAAGFALETLPQPEYADTPPVEIGIWYPSDAAPPETETLYGQHLSLDAPVAEGRHPLVVIAPGAGGWIGGHADTALALAEAGYVVAVAGHVGEGPETAAELPHDWMTGRPAELRAAIDYMTGGWKDAPDIDPSRIGVFGFSAGGYAALVAAGALPDIALAKSFCAGNPREYACRRKLIDGAETGQLGPALEQVAGDGRIGAVAAAAPLFGFAFGALDLAGIDIPVQIWSGGLDLRVPHNTNGALVAAGLAAAPDVHVAERAGHFAFLAPCNPEMETAHPAKWAMHCVDSEGFDRAAFHETLNAALVDFFDRSLDR